MKKIISVLLIILMSLIFCSYSYSKRCEKCLEERQNNKDKYVALGIAWRDFKTPIVHKDGKAYATYRCCYGHEYLVDLSE